jgi:hypothetical protein
VCRFVIGLAVTQALVVAFARWLHERTDETLERRI